MKKLIVLFVILGISIHCVYSQAGELLLKTADNTIYLDHKVQAKENFYSIGRLYNASAKDIAAYNKLDMSKGLNLGQMIRIPLGATNFSQTTDKGIPVYFKTESKESLQKISNANNHVALDNLRKWNGITVDPVSAGSKLVVGYLLTNENPTTLNPVKKEPEVAVIKKPEEKADKPGVKEPVAIPKKDSSIRKEAETDKPIVPVKKPETPTVNSNGQINSETGYFKSSFDQQVKLKPQTKNETVTSGIFKTASGWQDEKFYVLVDGIQPGTIVKITNPENNKAVYAKVLGEISGIRQNEGLNMRISNAAASILDVSDENKFIVKVNY